MDGHALRRLQQQEFPFRRDPIHRRRTRAAVVVHAADAGFLGHDPTGITVYYR